MANALINFTQGASVGGPGYALLGSVGEAVVSSNGDDGNVLNWQWTMADVPLGSSLPTGIVQNGALPTYTFTPDVSGCYVLNLVTQDNQGNIYQDTRVFGILETSGRLIPSYLASDGSMNFVITAVENKRGWSPFLQAYLKAIDAASGGGGPWQQIGSVISPIDGGSALSFGFGTATHSYDIALGPDSTATGNGVHGALALGAFANALAAGAVAGPYSTVYSLSGFAMGGGTITSSFASQAVAFSEGTSNGLNSFSAAGGTANTDYDVSFGPSSASTGGSIGATSFGNSTANADGSFAVAQSTTGGFTSVAGANGTTGSSAAYAVAFSGGTSNGQQSSSFSNGVTYGDSSFAIVGGTANDDYDIAMGNGAVSEGGGTYSAIAIGWETQALAQDSVAIGQAAQATGVDSIALGGFASGTFSVSIGYAAYAYNYLSLAMAGGTAFGDAAIAIGWNAMASNFSSGYGTIGAVAFPDSTATYAGSFAACGGTANFLQDAAFGPGSIATSTSAGGAFAAAGGQAYADSAAAFGAGSFANAANSAAFSEGVSSGAYSFATSNGQAQGQYSSAHGGATAQDTFDFSCGAGSTGTGTGPGYNFAGSQGTATGGWATAFGTGTATYLYDFSVGPGSLSTSLSAGGAFSAAGGQALNDAAFAVGASSFAYGVSSVAFCGGTAQYDNSVAIGPNMVEVANAYKFGDDANALVSLNNDGAGTLDLQAGSGQVLSFSNIGTQSTVGAAGGASLLPVSPDIYALLTVNGSQYAIPCFAVS